MYITNYITFIVPGCDYVRTKCNVQYVHAFLCLSRILDEESAPNRIRLRNPVDTLSCLLLLGYTYVACVPDIIYNFLDSHYDGT